jgi:hypothetical protein
MTSIVYQLPEDVGQREITRNGTVQVTGSDFPAGVAPEAGSIPVVLPRSGYVLPILDRFRTPSEVNRDHLGIPRISTPQAVIEATDQFEIRSQDWIQEVTGINERAEDGVFSARWTQLQNAVVAYDPIPDGSIEYDDLGQAARLELRRQEGGYQRVRLSTRNRFRYQVGRITRVSMGVEMSNNALEACTKTWGIGDARDGYFFQIQGDGVGDNFRLIYRSSSRTGLVRDIITPRSEFNRDKLDGTGASQVDIDFTKVTMYLVEWGWYGGTGAKFYVHVVDGNELNRIPRSRWVLCHEMLLPDQNPFPTLQTPSLPITVELANSGSLVEPQFMKRFGASVLVDGGTDSKREIQAIDANVAVNIGPLVGGLAGSTPKTVLIVESKDYAANGQLNVQQAFPLKLTATANTSTELLLFLDPVLVDESEVIGHNNGSLPQGGAGTPGRVEYALTVLDGGTETAIVTEDILAAYYSVDDEYLGAGLLSSTEVTFNSNQVVSSGKRIASYFVGANKTVTISLSNIFQLVRERLSTEYDTPFEFPTTQEDYQVVSQAGVTLTLNRKHRLVQEQRVMVGNTNYYVFSTPSEFSLTLADAPAGSQVTLATTPSKITAFFDLEFATSQTQRGVPIYRSKLALCARTVASVQNPLDGSEADAEWISVYEATTDNTYSPVSPGPTLNYALILGVN